MASFLIQLDIDGTTTVRLPVSQFAHDRAGQAGLSRLHTLGATNILFPAERGVPQGDVASPFGWNAVYDILYEPLPSNVATSRTQQHKRSPTLTTSYR